MLTHNQASQNDIRSVTMIGAGDGTVESCARILMVEMAITAACNPDVSRKEQSTLVMDLMKRAGKTKEMVSSDLGAVRYSASMGNGIGIVFGAAPQNKDA